jgi:hypothetical protein
MDASDVSAILTHWVDNVEFGRLDMVHCVLFDIEEDQITALNCAVF